MIGAASGKIGNIVYAVTNGIQTARVYQPEIANPRTKAQQVQRLKIALAGKISSIVSKEDLEGFTGNARIARSKFMSRLLSKTIVTTSGGVDTAKIKAQDIVFSEGNLDIYSAQQSASVERVTGNPNIIRLSIAASTLSPLAPAGYGELIIALLVDDETGNFDYSVSSYRTIDATTQLDVRVSDSTRTYDVLVYTVPYAINEQLRRMKSSGIGYNEGVYVDDILTSSSMRKYGVSHFITALSVS